MDETSTVLEFLLENLEFLSKNSCSLPWKIRGSLLRMSLPKLEIGEGNATTMRCFCDVRLNLATHPKGVVHLILFDRLASKYRPSLLSSNERAHVVALREAIGVIRSIYLRCHEEGIKNEQLQLLNHETRQWASKALDATDKFLLSPSFSPLSSELAIFERKFITIRRELSRVSFSDPSHAPIQVVIKRNSLRETSSQAPKEGEGDVLVGFEKVTSDIQDRLFSHDKQREVICIVGMAGIGKTTLAQKFYNNQCVARHFSFTAWTTVSEAYQRKNILCDLLKNIIDKHILSTMDEGDLADKLRKHLYGKKYLIAIDDVWHDKVWEDLESCFPDNNNKSRILMTTRIKEVAIRANLFRSPFHLSLLDQNESWTLFCLKAFREKRCPPMLEGVAREIVKKCGGLPLAIVVIARLVANKEMTVLSWSQFAKCMNAHQDDQEVLDQFMGILALSYDHLPFHLKLCFLYCGTFREDCLIPLKRLILARIAEGYIEKVENKSLEDVATSYLMELVDRNLVVISEKRSNGEIRACSVHDMLRALCIKKSMEKESSRVLHLYNSSMTSRNFDLMFHSLCDHFRCSCNFNIGDKSFHLDRDTRLSLYRLLRVLDLNGERYACFPTVILQLTHLKYLALHVKCVGKRTLPIDSLWNLETFILRHGGENELILQGFWKMEKLRHLYIYPSFEIEMSWACFPADYLVLDDIQTMTTLKCSSRIQDVLARTPNLRKLGIYLNEKDSPDFASLNHLETLEVNWFSTLYNEAPVGIPDPRMFPPKVKKLTLTTGYLDWKDMKVIGLLPNLEVLKVRYNCFSGPVWETCEGGFCNLKFLVGLHWIYCCCWFSYRVLEHGVADILNCRKH